MSRVNISGRTAMVALGQSVVKLVQVVFALVLVRLLSKEDWPAMALILTIYNAATNIGSLNLHMSFIFFYSHVPAQERRKLIIQTILLLAGAGILSAAIIQAVAPFLGKNFWAVKGLLPLLGLAVLLELPTMLLPQLLLAQERPGSSSAFNGTMGLIQFVAIMTPVLLGQGLKGAMLGLLAYAAARFVVFLVITLRSMPRGDRFRWDRAFLKSQLVYTAPLSFSMATSILNRNIDKWLVAGFDVHNFGAYALASYEVPFVSLIPFAIGAVLSTRMIHAFKHEKIQLALSYWHAATSRMMLLIVPLTVAITALAPEIVSIFFTTKYLSATIPFQIYSLIMLHRFAEYGAVLRAAGDTKSIWWSSCTILFAGLALNLPLVLLFGMVGVAAGTLGANLVAWLFILSRIARAFRVRFREVVQWDLYLTVLGLSATIGVAVYLLAPLSGFGTTGLFFLKLAAFFLLYAGIIKSVGLRRRCHPVPEDDEHFLRETGERGR